MWVREGENGVGRRDTAGGTAGGPRYRSDPVNDGSPRALSKVYRTLLAIDARLYLFHPRADDARVPPEQVDREFTRTPLANRLPGARKRKLQLTLAETE